MGRGSSLLSLVAVGIAPDLEGGLQKVVVGRCSCVEQGVAVSGFVAWRVYMTELGLKVGVLSLG